MQGAVVPILVMWQAGSSRRRGGGGSAASTAAASRRQRGRWGAQRWLDAALGTEPAAVVVCVLLLLWMLLRTLAVIAQRRGWLL